MNIGDYVRTKKGISKIEMKDYETIYTDTGDVFSYYKDNKGNEIKDYWISYSSNIIDLIEVGDYVNESYIQEIKEIKNNEMTCMLDSDYEFYSHIKNEDIKSIVTKEQFESMKYRLGDKE